MVTVSPNNTLEIPKELRDKHKIKPGDNFQFLEEDGQIKLVRVPRIEDFRGMLKGHKIDFVREKQDREI